MSPAPYPVVLDANILYAFILRDIILRAAEVGLCQPYWSEEILDETIRNLVADGKISAGGAPRLRVGIEEAFPEALVTGYQHLLDK